MIEPRELRCGPTSDFDYEAKLAEFKQARRDELNTPEELGDIVSNIPQDVYDRIMLAYDCNDFQVFAHDLVHEIEHALCQKADDDLTAFCDDGGDK